MVWNVKLCEDWMCIMNNGKGKCTHEGVILGRDPCLGWREPGGEWLLKYNLGEYKKYLKGEREDSPMELRVPIPLTPPSEPTPTDEGQRTLDVFVDGEERN